MEDVCNQLEQIQRDLDRMTTQLKATRSLAIALLLIVLIAVVAFAAVVTFVEHKL